MDGGTGLPVQVVPHDALRQGLSALKQHAEVSHPVEAIQDRLQNQQEQSRHEMLGNIYGSALPARMQIERQILRNVRRLPGMPSSHALYEATAGDLDDFGLEAYVGNPAEREVPGADLHSQMEARRRSATQGGPAPATRAFF